MKRIFNFLIVVICVIMTTGCESKLKDMAYSYTNESSGTVSVIRLYNNGKVLINRFSKWDIEGDEEIYMIKGRNMVCASYERRDSIINIIVGDEIRDKIIIQKDGGIRYKADVYRPDKRFKNIKPVGKYGGKSYEADDESTKLYMCFIDEETVLLASQGNYSDNIDLDYYKYEISGDKIIISGKGLIFKPEGENYLIMNNEWASLVMKYTGIVDDYKLYNYVLSDVE